MTKKYYDKTIRHHLLRIIPPQIRQWSKLTVQLSVAISVLAISQYAFAQSNNINISATVLSLVDGEQSSIIVDQDAHFADGETAYRLVVNARSAWGTAVPEKQVILTSDHGGDLILPSQLYTNSHGQAIFEVIAQERGLANYYATIDHMIELSPLEIEWAAPEDVQVLGTATNQGDPIKTVAISALILFILAFVYHLIVRVRQDAKLD